MARGCARNFQSMWTRKYGFQIPNVPEIKVHKIAWIGKKGTNEFDEISKEKCYELPSEFENS